MANIFEQSPEKSIKVDGMEANHISDLEIESLNRFAADGTNIREWRLRQIVEQISKTSEQRWTYEDAPNLVVYSIIELAFSYPKRANDLIESMKSLMQLDRLVPAVILARALVETTAMGRYYVERMEKQLAAGDYSKLEADFLRFYMGSKIGGGAVKSVHINDALRELDDIDLDYLSHLVRKYPSRWLAAGPDPVQTFKEKTSLLKIYDQLSEISHPNGLGTQYFYPAADAPDNLNIAEHYRFMTGVAIWQCHHLLTALDRIKNFADRFVSAFPDRIRFSEESLPWAPPPSST